MYSYNKQFYHGFAMVLTLVVGLTIVGPATVIAEDQTGGVPGDWLSRYMGARTAGVGGSYVAMANDPLGVVWNPAGLSYMSQNEIYLETSRLFEDTSINGFSFGMPARRFPSFGISVLNLRSGEFDRRSDLNEPLGDFNESDMAFLFSASKHFSRRFAVGTNVKVVRQSVDEFDGTGVGLDLGLLYHITPALRVGASLLNLGGPNLTLRDTEEQFPVEFRGGFALQFFHGRGLISAELDHREGPGVSFHGGSEFWVYRGMALRFGYADQYPAGGFSYRVTPAMRFDYAAADNELGVTHRFGMSYKFGGFFASSEAVPPIFSPIGQQSVTKFHLKAKTKADAESWRLEIVDKSNQVVRQFGGKGVPPAHVMWDGKDESGLSLPDGVYHYHLVVIDRERREFVAHERTVEITTEGPQGSVPVYTD
ncbi:MAG: PorV/PorQ family protein [Candidatus Krumholzibacteria bacterium]|nr:PorV/PorQ family protein [Candidatus Krumholzibacteria bacterium]